MRAEDNTSLESLFDDSSSQPIDWAAGRRAFLRTIGLGAGLAAMGQVSLPNAARAQAITDTDILNFALNLEYLEAEFYLIAALNRRLADGDTTGTGNRGPTNGGSPVPFESKAVANYAKEIAADEEAHVKFLRAALGGARVARPTINLNTSFTAAARAAGVIAQNRTYNAFASENHFLVAAFLFEDVGVTAYKGAARLISNKDFLEAAAGLLAVEAYHAGTIRTVLYNKGMDRDDAENGVFSQTRKLSDLRDTADGPGDKDQGIGSSDVANIVPTDQNGLAFSRSAREVLNIVYLGGSDQGGFFPAGLNGTIS